MSQMSFLIVIHFYSYDSFSCVASSFSHGCTIVLTETAHHDSFLTHFLTHIILHASRIFRQCHNHIVCLVVEWLSLPCMHIRASSAHGLDNSDITGILIWQKFINSASVTVQSKCSTSRFGVSRTLKFLSQSYINIAYIINFQVQLTPGKLHFKFELCILGLCLSVYWVLGIRKKKSASNNRVTNSMRNRSWSSGLLIH